MADKPFAFLAACIELNDAWTQGLDYITRLPISFDGSCNGWQHLCAMTRSEEGKEVNLQAVATANCSSDFYSTATLRTIIELAKNYPAAAEKIEELGIEIDRALVKPLVVSTGYGSTDFGRRRQLRRCYRTGVKRWNSGA